MNCKECSDNKNGWCEFIKTNKKEEKEISCKYLLKEYMVVKDARDYLEKMSTPLTLEESYKFIENALEKNKLFIINKILQFQEGFQNQKYLEE